MPEKLKKKVLISLAAGALIYLALALYADFDSVIEAFGYFNWFFLPLILLFSYLNYFTRFLKWDYYLKLLKVKIPRKDSYSIFMSGLIMSITPGKMGELLKSYLVKEVTGEQVSKTAPVVFAERITDFISLIFIALAGAYAYDYDKTIIAGTGIFFIIVMTIISNRKLSEGIIHFVSKTGFLRKFSDKLLLSYESSYKMLRPGPLFKMVLLSLVAWFFECFGFYLVLVNFGIGQSLFWASFAYAFATIAGSLTMLPGGLGVTEGSLTLLLIEKGITKNLAVVATFVIRVVTLWFALAVGIISLFLYQKKFGKPYSISTNN